MQTGNSQAIAAAQVTLASSNVGGDPTQLRAPGDLAVPANLDLGSVTLANPYYSAWGGGLAPDSLYWNGLGIGGTFGPGWGDVPFYAWDNDGAYGWGTSYWPTNFDGGLGWSAIGAYAWWGNAGMVAPQWTVFDPFGYGAGGYNGNYFAGGFGAFNYGSWYGAPFGYWFGNWGWYGNGVGYSWLPFYAQPGAPSASTEPTAAVQKEQTSVNLLSTLATVGKDAIEVLKNAAPVEIQAATGLAKLGIAAGYAAINLATDGQPTTDQNGAPQPPSPLTQLVRQSLRSRQQTLAQLELQANAADDDAADEAAFQLEQLREEIFHETDELARSAGDGVIVKNTLAFLDPVVAAWWSSTKGKLAFDEHWWRFRLVGFEDSWIDGTSPVARVYASADDAEIAIAIIKASQGGATGQSFRRFKAEHSKDFAQGYAEWQKANLEEAAKSAAALARMYYEGIAAFDAAGNLVVTVNGVLEDGLSWRTALGVLPFVGHLRQGVVNAINSLEIQVLKDGVAVTQELSVSAAAIHELSTLSEAEASEIIKEVEAAGSVAEAEAIIEGRLVFKGKWVTESTAGWKPRAIKYQEQITGVPAGKALEINDVRFDGIARDRSGLVEAKGPGYAHELENPILRRSLSDQWLKRATRQVEAANGAPITWYVAEKDAADTIRDLFGTSKNPQIKKIKVEFEAPRT